MNNAKQKLGPTVAFIKGIDDDYGYWYVTISSLSNGGLPRLGKQLIYMSAQASMDSLWVCF
jgi:hypothetical protein